MPLTELDYTTSGEATFKNNIKVVVRVRPLSITELSKQSETCIQANTSNREICVTSGKSEGGRFQFDDVIGPDALKEEVYGKTGKGLVENIFEGYNATIIAYGQTGSGEFKEGNFLHFLLDFIHI